MSVKILQSILHGYMHGTVKMPNVIATNVRNRIHSLSSGSLAAQLSADDLSFVVSSIKVTGLPKRTGSRGHDLKSSLTAV